MKEKISKKLILIIVAVAVLTIIGLIVYFSQFSGDIGQEKIEEKVTSYISENLLAPGITASVGETIKSGSVYKVGLQIKEGENVLGEIDVYATKDGKFFFPEGFNMDEPLEDPNNQQPVEAQPNLSSEEEVLMSNFIQCLAENNFVIYASRTCPACIDLMAKFGGYDIAASILIECNENSDLCTQKNIENVPTIFINDQEYSGDRSLEGFSQATGCNL